MLQPSIYRLLIDESLSLIYVLSQTELPQHVEYLLTLHVHHSFYQDRIEPLLFQLGLLIMSYLEKSLYRLLSSLHEARCGL